MQWWVPIYAAVDGDGESVCCCGGNGGFLLVFIGNSGCHVNLIWFLFCFLVVFVGMDM